MPFKSMVLFCLRVQFTKKKLSPTCEEFVAAKVESANLDFKQNPLLAQACKTEVFTGMT